MATTNDDRGTADTTAGAAGTWLRVAIRRYVREVAALPRCTRTLFGQRPDDPECAEFHVVVAPEIPGAVTPPPTSAWLAFFPFHDLAVHRSEQLAIAAPGDVPTLLRRRISAIELLVRLAATSRWRWAENARLWTNDEASTMSHCLGPSGFWPAVVRDIAHGNNTAPIFSRVLVAMRDAPAPRFMIKIATSSLPDNFVELLNQMLQALSDGSRVFEGLEMPEEIQSALANEQPSLSKRLTVELALSIDTGRIGASQMYDLMDVLENFSDAQRARAAVDRIEYRLVMIRFHRTSSIAGSALEALEEMTRSDKLHLQHVDVGWLNEIEEPVLRSFFGGFAEGSPLREIETSFSDDSSKDAEDTESSERIKLKSFAVSNASTLTKLTSALRYNEAVEEVDINCDFRVSTAHWLAYGLFHCDSSSRVHTIRLRSAYATNDAEGEMLLQEWSAAFKNVLMHVAPSKELAAFDMPAKSSSGAFDEVQLPNTQRLFVTIKPKTKLKAEPNTRGKLLHTVNNKNTECFEVVRRLSAWVALVIPGSGVGWAAASSIVHEVTRPSLVDQVSGVKTNLRVKSFSWIQKIVPQDLEQHIEAMLDVLEVIGGSLESLNLPKVNLSSEYLQRVLLYCPNLVELNLHGNQLTSISPLVNAWRESRCKIKRLSVAQLQTDDLDVLSQEVARFLQEQPNALQRLSIHLAPSRSLTDQTMLQDMINALSSSRQLEYLRIHFTNMTQDISKCKVSNPGRIALLPLRAKLAFLSAVRLPSVEAYSRLDSNVIGKIFQFAQSFSPRDVDLVSTYLDDLEDYGQLQFASM